MCDKFVLHHDYSSDDILVARHRHPSITVVGTLLRRMGGNRVPRPCAYNPLTLLRKHISSIVLCLDIPCSVSDDADATHRDVDALTKNVPWYTLATMLILVGGYDAAAPVTAIISQSERDCATSDMLKLPHRVYKDWKVRMMLVMYKRLLDLYSLSVDREPSDVLLCLRFLYSVYTVGQQREYQAIQE